MAARSSTSSRPIGLDLETSACAPDTDCPQIGFWSGTVADPYEATSVIFAPSPALNSPATPAPLPADTGMLYDAQEAAQKTVSMSLGPSTITAPHTVGRPRIAATDTSDSERRARARGARHRHDHRSGARGRCHGRRRHLHGDDHGYAHGGKVEIAATDDSVKPSISATTTLKTKKPAAKKKHQKKKKKKHRRKKKRKGKKS